MRPKERIIVNQSPSKFDLLYALIKVCANNEDELWPGWTGFSTLLKHDDVPEVSRVGYLPIINGPSTEYSTLYEVL